MDVKVFRLRVVRCRGRDQTVYKLAEKHDSSLDLIERNLAENDLVYELTEIDTSFAGKVVLIAGGQSFGCEHAET